MSLKADYDLLNDFIDWLRDEEGLRLGEHDYSGCLYETDSSQFDLVRKYLKQKNIKDIGEMGGF